jgi:hypothetical protein
MGSRLPTASSASRVWRQRHTAGHIERRTGPNPWYPADVGTPPLEPSPEQDQPALEVVLRPRSMISMRSCAGSAAHGALHGKISPSVLARGGHTFSLSSPWSSASRSRSLCQLRPRFTSPVRLGLGPPMRSTYPPSGMATSCRTPTASSRPTSQWRPRPLGTATTSCAPRSCRGLCGGGVQLCEQRLVARRRGSPHASVERHLQVEGRATAAHVPARTLDGAPWPSSRSRQISSGRSSPHTRHAAVPVLVTL